MNKVILWLVAIFLIGAVAIAEARQPKKVPRKGYPTLGSFSPPAPDQEAFRDGLRELGYIEGRNIHVEYRNESNQL